MTCTYPHANNYLYSNVFDIQVQHLLNDYLVTTVTQTVLARWQPDQIQDDDKTIIEEYKVEDYMVLVNAVGGLTQASIEGEINNMDSITGNWLVKQLNLMM